MLKKLYFNPKAISAFLLLSCLFFQQYSLIAMPIENVLMAEVNQVTGKVTDETGSPMPGVTVVLKGTSNGTITDIDGNFSIDIPSNNGVLVFSFVGYLSQEVTLNNQSNLSIQLSPDSMSLEEYVVVGYGTESRRNITAAVASIDPDEIKSLPKANVVEMLDGRLPGVQVMSDNIPGGGTSLRVRGFSTINDNDPLVIVDGIPVSNGLNSINPNDIETMQVLKDAASASVYGSRAANGVVIITTKKGGNKDSFQVSLDAYSGVQSPFNQPRMLNAQQYGDALWEATKNDGQTPSHDIYGNDPNQASIPAFLNSEQTIPSADTDWVKEIMRTAPIHSYNLSLVKGGAKAQNSLSLGYFNQEGIIKHSGFDRFSARFNSTYKLTNFLTLGENIGLSYRDQVSVNTNSALGSIIYNAYKFPSIVPVTDINGVYAGNPINDIANPLGSLSRGKDNNQKRIQALGNVFASINIDNFVFKSVLGIDFENYNIRSFSPKYNEILSINNTNSLSTRNSFNYQSTFSNTLNYNNSFGKHNVDALVGQEAIKYYGESFASSRDNFLYEDASFRYLTFGTENQLNSGSANSWSLNSYFGRVNYNYDLKYLFSATIRRDGTSRLAKNKYGTFPAFSLGWRLDREEFFNLGNNFSSFLVRGSWGQTGNQSISSYATVDSYTNNNANSDYALDGSQGSVYTGLTQSRVPNPNLKWETTNQLSIGLDLGFFSDKLNITADYFDKVTNDILVYNAVPLTYGGTNDGQWINDGKMRNHGFELDLNYADNFGDVNYRIGLNLTSLKNELTELNNVTYLGIPSSTLHSVNFDQEVTRSTVGQPIGSFFGYEADGIFKNAGEVDSHGIQPNAQPGDIRFKDINNDGKLDDEDRTYIGTPHPSLLLGLNLNFEYKGFDLGLFFNGSFGNDIYNLTKYNALFFNQAAYNKDVAILDAWSESNPDSNIPRLSLDDPNNNIRPSSYFIEDGSYVKLNNLQLGYTVNSLKTKNVGLRIYSQVSNVFTITKYSGLNPQIGLQSYSASNRNLDIGVDRGLYPPSRTIVLGCNLTF